MNYGRWIPLDEAVAPDGPGLLQVRYGEGSEGLIAYPAGKSAMAYYGADDASLATALAEVRALVDAVARARLRVRFAAPEPGRSPSRSLAESLRGFRQRFGALPVLNGG
jgi:hypothetical protein